MNQTERLLLVVGLGGATAFLVWQQYRKNNTPTDKDVQQSALKTAQKANGLEQQAAKTAEMAAKSAYQAAQAQLLAAQGAQRYAAGGIAYPQFAPSSGSLQLIAGRQTRGVQLGVV